MLQNSFAPSFGYDHMRREVYSRHHQDLQDTPLSFHQLDQHQQQGFMSPGLSIKKELVSGGLRNNDWSSKDPGMLTVSPSTVSQKRKSRLMNSSRGGTYTKLKYGVCWFMNKWELGLRSPLFGFIVILIFFSRIFRILVINLFWNFQSLYPP